MSRKPTWEELKKRLKELEKEANARKHAEEALRESEKRYRDLIQNVPVGLYRNTPGAKGSFIMGNPAILKMFGYKTLKEFLQTPVAELYWDSTEREVFSEKLISQGQVIAEEVKLKKRDKTLLWGAVTAKAIRNKSGIIKYFDGMIEDITERKKYEQAIFEEKQFSDKVIESMPGLFFMLDEQFHYVRWNKNVENVYGYTLEELTTLDGLEDLVTSDDRQKLKQAAEKAMRGGSGYCEYDIVTKEGRKISFAGDARCVTIGGDKYLVGLEIDITKRKQAEKALKKAFSKIKQLKDQLQAENVYLTEQIKQEHYFDEIIGQSDALKYLLFKVKQVAPTKSTVLILGETGTGKDLIARAIHNLSPRKDRPLVKVNCATLPSNLIESELFGHEKGAFTSADDKKIGRFEIANRATIFLDEISELPLELQSKLLRVVEDGEFERLGGSRTIKVNVRILTATNRNLEQEVREGRFRQDLWYRLNVYPISVPALRERTEDIPLLVDCFMKRFAKELGKSIEKVSQETMSVLQGYHWPGNVRELKNVIERSAISSQGSVLKISDRLETPKEMDLRRTSRRTLQEIERDYILQVLEETNWRIEGKKGAALLLDLNPSTLRARLRKLGIKRRSSVVQS
jgi:PAS domain S-box-containing protein